MSERTLNLGILAHVDAGKTTLTERLLYGAGVVDEIGSVDAGTTQTDTLELERRRGITIRAAVVSFAIGDVTVNLIDTPGHPDFIAEVERVLSVLDGAVLVLSAIEGVQPQTLVLFRALRRLRIPTLLFANKIDRAGADEARVLRTVAERLTPAVVPMGTVRNAGFSAFDPDDAEFRARLAEVLGERDESILAAFVEDEDGLSPGRLRAALAAQTAAAAVHPLVFGSAITGAGVEELTAAIAELLPARAGDSEGPLAGRVFKIERGPSGEKIAYARLFSGTLRVRERLRIRDEEERVTAVAVFAGGGAAQCASASAGSIAKLWGLSGIRIGDAIGDAAAPESRFRFAPPTVEAVVAPRDPGDRERLRVALAQLAEQDPLIGLRQDALDGALSVSLYGEVQKEVVEATLASDFGLVVEFRETTIIHVERPSGFGEAAESLGTTFAAGMGLRVEPAAPGSGVAFRLRVDVLSVPLYVFKNVPAFEHAMRGFVERALREGPYGWQVTDCVVTMTRSEHAAPGTTAADFRKLTPLVLARALAQAGTAVCEPFLRVRIEPPATAVGAVLSAVARLGAPARAGSRDGALAVVEAELPAARVQEVQRQLPGLTGGEGLLETEFAGYRPVPGDPPARTRTTPNPLNREEYLLHLARRV